MSGACHETRLLLTAREAAAALSISARKLWALTASGDVPHVRIGRAVRYPADALAEWVARRTAVAEQRR
jgi:excisionase family DNA binding protein